MILGSSFFSILYIVIAIFAILALGGLSGREREQRKRRLTHSEVSIEYRDMPNPITSDVMVTYVGGARFYCDRDDRRCFVGFVRHDPDNDAPAIYRNDLKMLGHIPRERLDEYLSWSQGETFPCVGYVLPGADVESLNTELKIIKPYNRGYVESEIKRFVGWTTMTHGADTEPVPDSYQPLLDPYTIAKLQKSKKKRHASS